MSCVGRIPANAGMSEKDLRSYCNFKNKTKERNFMAEVIKLRVKCHACSYMMEGSARYGAGHYVPEGVDFEFIAIGKVETPKGRRVKAEISAVCPNCGVKNKWIV